MEKLKIGVLGAWRGMHVAKNFRLLNCEAETAYRVEAFFRHLDRTGYLLSVGKHAIPASSILKNQITTLEEDPGMPATYRMTFRRSAQGTFAGASDQNRLVAGFYLDASENLAAIEKGDDRYFFRHDQISGLLKML